MKWEEIVRNEISSEFSAERVVARNKEIGRVYNLLLVLNQKDIEKAKEIAKDILRELMENYSYAEVYAICELAEERAKRYQNV